MNKLIPIAALLLLSSLASAQDHAADRQALLKILATVESAINQKDVAGLDSYLLPTTTVVFQDTTVARGPTEIKAYFEHTLGGASAVLSGLSSKAEISGPATFLRDDVAVAFGHSNDRFEFRTGNTMDLHTKWSTTVVREDDGWHIAALHLSNSLFDNPLLSGAKRMAWIAAAAGFVAGLLGMFLIGRLRKR